MIIVLVLSPAAYFRKLVLNKTKFQISNFISFQNDQILLPFYIIYMHIVRFSSILRNNLQGIDKWITKICNFLKCLLQFCVLLFFCKGMSMNSDKLQESFLPEPSIIIQDRGFLTYFDISSTFAIELRDYFFHLLFFDWVSCNNLIYRLKLIGWIRGVTHREPHTFHVTFSSTQKCPTLWIDGVVVFFFLPRKCQW